jgi:hypothetical protein
VGNFSSFVNRRMLDHCFGVAACPFPTDHEISIDNKSIAFDAAVWDTGQVRSETEQNGAVVTDASVTGSGPTTVTVSADFGGYGRQDIVSAPISGLTGDYGVGSVITFADAAIKAYLQGIAIHSGAPGFPNAGTSKPTTNAILSHIFGVSAYTMPTTLDLAFAKHDGSFNFVDYVTPAITEFAGTGYARQATAGSWGASVAGTAPDSWIIKNNAPISFMVGAGGWSLFGWVAVLLDSLGALMHAVAGVHTGSFAASDVLRFPAGSLAFQFGS